MLLAMVASGIVAMLLAAGAQARSGSLTTLFATNNSFAGDTFDLEVKHGVRVTGVDVNVDNPGTGVEVSLWTHAATAVGFEESPSGWTLRGSATGVSAGANIPTPIPLSFRLPKGSYGVLLGATNYPTVNWLYTDGAPAVFQDSVLKLTTGKGLNDAFFTPGSTFANRQWNGTIHYEFCVVPKVKGKKLRRAKRRITRAKCSVGKVSKRSSSKVARGKVVRQRPRPGARRDFRSPVKLVVSRGPRG